ncbi:MAG: Rpn family recombination-promoting nuclease/putative transposase [Myxococcota bacterium]
MPRKKSTPSRRTAAAIKPIYRRDKLFKATSTSLNIHKEIVRRYLPKKLLSKVDVDQVRVMNSVSVDTHLRERLADLALEMPFKSGTGTCCVCIEQQTQHVPVPLLKGISNAKSAKRSRRCISTLTESITRT